MPSSSADHVIDMGLGAGIARWASVIAQGTPAEHRGGAPRLADRPSTSAQRALRIEVPREASRKPGRHLPEPQMVRMHQRARQQPAVASRWRFPVGLLICVTGVSGSGKSTLVNETLYTAVGTQDLSTAHAEPEPSMTAIEGLDAFRQGDQCRPEPDRTHAAFSNPATYTGLFTTDP